MSETLEVIKCTKCGMIYNGSQYAQCPYCVNGDGDAGAGVGKKKKWPRIKIGSLVKTPIHEQKDSEGNQSSIGKLKDTGADDSTHTKEENEEKKQAEAVSGNVGNLNEEKDGRKSNNEKAGADVLQKTDGNNQKYEKIDDIPLTVGVGEQIPNWMTSPSGEKSATNPVKDSSDAESKGNTPSPTPSPSDTTSLTKTIGQVGKTTSKYVSFRDGRAIEPVVGWLIGVKGAYYGQAFPLKSGVNRVGRSSDMEVALLLDNSISRKAVIEIVYDGKDNEFNAFSDSNDCRCSINGKRLYRNERKTLEGYEEFEFGDQESNKFIFVPLSGDRFLWSNYPL